MNAMKQNSITIPADENGPETEAEMHAEETRRAVANTSAGSQRQTQQKKERERSQGAGAGAIEL